MNTHLLAEIIFIFIIDVPQAGLVLANYSFRATHNVISDVNVTYSPIKSFLTRGIIQPAERELKLIYSLSFGLWFCDIMYKCLSVCLLYVACRYTPVGLLHSFLI